MKILVIDPCNFDNYPIGGTLTFIKQLMGAFGSELILVGLSSDKNTPVGKWIKKEFNQIEYDFFAFRKVIENNRKPIVPERIKNYLALKYYKKKIKRCPIKTDNVFLQTNESLLAIQKWNYKNICFRSPGVENMLKASRFWYAKYFSKTSQRLFYNALKNINIIFASADKSSILEFKEKSQHLLDNINIVQFPTRIDTSAFKPLDKLLCRTELRLAEESLLVVSTGRLSKHKGWKFMIDSYAIFKKTYSRSKFILLGDGEDRTKIEQYIRKLGLDDYISISGSLKPVFLTKYINASDLFIMGSSIEGWSTSLMEAIACAKPVCVTKFGSAADLVENGKNGYIVDSFDQFQFAAKMIEALKMNPLDLFAKSKYFSNFSLNNLKNDLTTHWKLL